MSINEAEIIRNKIRNSKHFSSCLNYKDHNNFNYLSDELNKIRNCYDNIISYERDIINIYYQNKIKENEIKGQSQLFEKELEIKRKENENSIKIKENQKENELNEFFKKWDMDIFENEYQLKQLNDDLKNLEKEINELDLKNEQEIELLKKEKLNELKNEYQLNLLKYKNMKELEKAEREKNEEIKRKEFEAEKEIKFNELKSKAEFVKKIITLVRNIELNNI